jgi:hypothetical protein
MKQKLEKLLEQYGYIALVVYFALFFLTWLGMGVAIAAGVHVKGAAGKAGIVGAAYVATELTKPLRFIATLFLTPLLAQLWRKIRPPQQPPA